MTPNTHVRSTLPSHTQARHTSPQLPDPGHEYHPNRQGPDPGPASQKRPATMTARQQHRPPAGTAGTADSSPPDSRGQDTKTCSTFSPASHEPIQHFGTGPGLPASPSLAPTTQSLWVMSTEGILYPQSGHSLVRASCNHKRPQHSECPQSICSYKAFGL